VRAVQVREFGGPEALELVELPDPDLRPGHVMLDVAAIGVNYADTHQAENSYLAPQTLPFVPGSEVVGTTPEGQRVAALLGTGGYAERALAPTASLLPLPDDVDNATALALLVQGLTAWHLLRTCASLSAGESVVVHAAAGGVGSIAVQLARIFGAGTIVGTASTPEKRQVALDIGADAAIDPGANDLRGELRAAVGGSGVDIVLEMTGGRVFDQSLSSLAPFGRLVTYGTASRESPSPVVPGALVARSRAVIGFWLAHCTRRPEMIVPPYAELLDLVRTGRLRPIVGSTYPLTAVRQAHEDLRARRTTGKIVLLPSESS
jgi:NADPH:quinone reductase